MRKHSRRTHNEAAARFTPVLVSCLFAGFAVFALSALVAGDAAADDIVLKKGKLRGVVVKTENGMTYVNVYNSTNPQMTHGVQALPTEKIKRIVKSKVPHVIYLNELCTSCPPGTRSTADAEFKMGQLAEKHKLAERAKAHYTNALRRDPQHADARKALGSDLDRMVKSDPQLNPKLRTALDAWFALEDLAERKSKLRQLERDFGFKRNIVFMERVRRSRRQPKKLQNDRPLTLNARTHKGVYTLLVPDDYDPMRSWPLVLALHGGGPDGKDGRDVFGSGSEAMSFYASGARQFGYIVACPTALRAPWDMRENEPFLLSVLEEVSLLYNVDLNRVYLTGHSMGGIGTWHYGPKLAHRWAAFAPMAGAGLNRMGWIRKTRTPVYIYHSEDDPVVGCGDSRVAAERFKKAGHDFVYTELNDRAHAFPGEIANEMWAFFHARRLAATRKRSAKGKFRIQLEPYSSFAVPVSKVERAYLGSPGEAPATDKKALMEKLLLGGGAAIEAAAGLVKLKDKTTVSPLAALVKSKKRADDVRAAAATALGGLGFKEASPALQGALKNASLELVCPLATALGQLRDAKARKALTKAMRRVTREFHGRLMGAYIALADRKRCDAAHAAIARALGALGDPDAVDSLRTVVTSVLLKKLQPDSYGPAQSEAEQSLGRCVIAFLESFAAIGDERGLELIDTLERAHGRLDGVKTAADGARTKLNAAIKSKKSG